MHRLFSPRVILYTAILLTLDMTLVPLFRIGDSRFVLGYLLVVYAAFQWGWNRAVPTALFIGVLRDLLSTGMMGLETFSLFLSSLSLAFVSMKVQRESLLLRFFAAAGFVLTAVLIQLLLSGFLTGIQYDYGYYLSITLGSAIYTGLAVPVFFFISAKWFGDHLAIKQYDLFS